MNTYKNVRLSATQKEKINVLTWWKDNQNEFPHLFLLIFWGSENKFLAIGVFLGSKYVFFWFKITLLEES